MASTLAGHNATFATVMDELNSCELWTEDRYKTNIQKKTMISCTLFSDASFHLLVKMKGNVKVSSKESDSHHSPGFPLPIIKNVTFSVSRMHQLIRHYFNLAEQRSMFVWRFSTKL